MMLNSAQLFNESTFPPYTVV